MHTLLSRRHRAVWFALASFILAVSAQAQTSTGDGSTGSGTTSDTGSGTTGSGTGSGTATGSGTSASYDSPNTYDLGGGTVTLASAILNGGTVTNGTLDVSGSITGYSGSVSAQLSGTAYFNKDQTGLLTLSGANSYTGNTNLVAGTLRLNGSLGSTNVAVFIGATLGGTGTINGPTTVQSGGILAPGDATGTLTFANSLTLNAGAVFNYSLGTSSSLLAISGGTLTGPSGGTVSLNFTAGSGFTAGNYTLVDYTGATASGFDATSFSLGSTPSGWNFSIHNTGHQVSVAVSAVPEPSTTAAVAAGAALLAAILWRKRVPLAAVLRRRCPPARA